MPPGRLLLPVPLGGGLAGRVCLVLARSLVSPAYATARLGQHRADGLGGRLIRWPPVVPGAGGDPVGGDSAPPGPRSTRWPAARSGPGVSVPAPRAADPSARALGCAAARSDEASGGRSGRRCTARSGGCGVRTAPGLASGG